MKNKSRERLAALLAGGEATARERTRFASATESDVSLIVLRAELDAQRESLLALRDENNSELDPSDDMERTRAALRLRMESAEAPGWNWRPWGMAGAGLALLALALIPWSRSRTVVELPVAPSRHAVPAPGLASTIPAGTAAMRSVAKAARTGAKEAKAREAPDSLRPDDSPRVARPSVASASLGIEEPSLVIDEIVTQENGEVRLRVKTENPNVVIYLFADDVRESGGEE